jgi:Spy/CpxP family protein refolding chaperone
MKYSTALLAIVMVFGVWLPASHAEAPPRDRETRADTRRGDHAKRGDRGDRLKRKQRGKRIAKMRAKLLRKRMGLDEAKAKKVEALFKQFRKKRRTARKAVGSARKGLNELLRSKSGDQAAYRSAIEKLRQAHDAMHNLRNNEWQALSREMTPKQQAILLRALGKMQRRMQRGGSRGGPRNRRGGPRNRRGEHGGRGRPRHPGGRGGPPHDGPPMFD